MSGRGYTAWRRHRRLRLSCLAQREMEVPLGDRAVEGAGAILCRRLQRLGMGRHRRAVGMAGLWHTPQQGMGQAPLLQHVIPLHLQRPDMERHGVASRMVHIQRQHEKPRGLLPTHIQRAGGMAGPRGLCALQWRRTRLLRMGQRTLCRLCRRLVPAFGIQDHRLRALRRREQHLRRGAAIHQRLLPRMPGLLAPDGHHA